MSGRGFRRPAGAPPWVVGHRGVRGAAPENTMMAFELAAAQGADGIELDVRTCRTEEVVVCHDATLARCSGGREQRAVSEMTRAELERADVGAGQPIPMLEEVLSWARSRSITVNVEMKRDVPHRRHVVEQTVRALARSNAQEVIVSSFDPLMLAYFAFRCPRLPIGYLFARDQSARAASLGAALLRVDAIHPDRACVDEATSRRWRSRRQLINVWTVNDPNEAVLLAALGVDALITDVPSAVARAVR